MSIEFWKSIITTAVLTLALLQTGLMLQVYGKARLFLGSRKGLRRAHRLSWGIS